MFARTPPTTIQTWSQTLEGLRNKDILTYLPTGLWPCCSCLVLDRGANAQGAPETRRTPPLLEDSAVLPESCECWAYVNQSLLPLFETSFWLGYLANTDSTLNSVRIVFWQELFFRLHNSRLAVLLRQSSRHFSTPLTLLPFPLMWIFFLSVWCLQRYNQCRTPEECSGISLHIPAFLIPRELKGQAKKISVEHLERAKHSYRWTARRNSLINSCT